MEVKQFTQGQFDEAFEGSAVDLLTKIAAEPKGTTPATPTAPTTPAQPAKGTPTQQDPIKAERTLDPERDAAALLNEADAGEEGEGTSVAAPAAAQPAKGKGGRPPVKKLDAGTKQMVDNLIKEGKLFGFDDGKIDTEKDLQDLLDANFAHRDQARIQELQAHAMQSLPPAMQFVAQYANMVNGPAELLPLLQSMSKAENFSTLDENNPSHQEAIVRERMRLNGDSDTIIDQEIQDLKDRAKLADKAKAYKPILQQFYDRQAQQLMAQKQAEEAEFVQQVQENERSLRKVLDQDNFDGIRLSRNHKGAVYELLAVPREEYGGGMGIYHVIDQLFQQGQFNRLAKLALLAADEKAFEEVFGTKIKMGAADGTIRTLNTGRKAAGPTQEVDDDNDPLPPTVARPTRTSFGFGR